MQNSLEILGIKYNIDNNLVRGFDYYTKTAFEIVSTGLGSQNAICGGGRYDNLIEELGYKPTPSVGFGMGLERLMITLESLGVNIPCNTRPTCYIITTNKKSEEIGLSIANNLRKENIACELDVSRRSIKAQMKTSGKMNAKWTIIIGEEEIQNNMFTVKNMDNSLQEQIPLDKLLEYLTQ